MININTAFRDSHQMSAPTCPPLRNTYYAQQRGTALLVAMVLIFMMTIMGMSALRETSLERRMTTNAVQKSIAFQLAESTTTQVSENPANLAVAYNANGLPVETVKEESARGIEVVGEAIYLGQSNAVGYSLSNSGGFQILSFEIHGTSHHDDAQVTVEVRQGIRRLVPAQ